MIFLCAQPDGYYFKWQLELLIYNFNSLGINPEQIHILIGYNPAKGLRYFYKDFIKQNKEKARFFVYKDTRTEKEYIPSMRPHIIAKHFREYPHLSEETIFYHDSDIIFTRLPNFSNLIHDDRWYVSDTRDYLDSGVIKRCADERLFHQMCNIVGIDPELVINNDNHCGGAQYLLKSVPYSFWKKVERDSEALYTLIRDYNDACYAEAYLQRGVKKSEYRGGLQAWIADMWAVFWNSLALGKDVKIHKELDFMIAKSPFEELEEKSILHYSGDSIGIKVPIFWKNDYVHTSPFYDARLAKVSPETVSCYLYKVIKSYRSELDKSRFDLSDVTFLIPVKIDSESRLENLYAVTAYLNKFFKTNIIVGEMDSESKIDIDFLPECCEHYFIENNEVLMHRTHLNNVLLDKASTPICAIYDTDVVFPVEQLVEGVEMLRKNQAHMVSPYNGIFRCVTNMFKPIFGKILDPLFLRYNEEIFPNGSERSYGGAVLFDKASYKDAGNENEFFTSWGPEDIERVKRMTILGYKVRRVQGSLFHLPHDRLDNSGYQSNDDYLRFIEEYLKICNMNKQELRSYINSWN